MMHGYRRSESEKNWLKPQALEGCRKLETKEEGVADAKHHENRGLEVRLKLSWRVAQCQSRSLPNNPES